VPEAAGRIFGGEGSRGNGAAMRVAPVAVRFADDPPRLRSEAAASARLTHAHPVGVDGAVVQAAAIGAALRGEPILAAAQEAAATREMRAGLRDVAELVEAGARSEEVARRIGSSFDARESVCAGICSALAAASFEHAVTSAVRLGGDTDTVAAMAGAVAGARDGVASIPARWLQELEDGERGRRHVERLADRLAGAR
jgi:ADP-ribosylglycohydrolase